MELTKDIPFRLRTWILRQCEKHKLDVNTVSFKDIKKAAGPRCWVSTFPKVQYSTLREAKLILGGERENFGKQVYPCMECLYWHIGQPLEKTAENKRARRKRNKQRKKEREQQALEAFKPVTRPKKDKRKLEKLQKIKQKFTCC